MLQCKWLKSLAIYWIKVRELWVLYECVLRQFSVFPRIHAHIFARKLQKITKCFQYGYKTKTKLKHITHYAIFQNRRICTSCRLYGLVHYAACAFCPYINSLQSALVSEYSLSSCLCGVGLYGRWERERVSVFDGFVFINVDVKYIRHYRRMCKFICVL